MIKSLYKTQPFYVLTDIFFMAASFFVPYVLKYNSFDHTFVRINRPNFAEHCFIFILWAILVIIAFKSKRLYRTERNLTIPQELFRVFARLLYVSIIIGSVIFYAKYQFFSRQVFIENFMALCVLLGGWRIIKRLILRKLIRGGYHNINILVVGVSDIFEMIVAEIKRQPHLGLKIMGSLDEHQKGDIGGVPVLGGFSDFISIAKKHFVQEIIIALPLTQRPVLELVKQAQKMRVGIRVVPEHLEDPLPILGISHLGMIPLLTYQQYSEHPSERALKRLFDIVISLLLITLLSIPCVIIAILIKITSPGPFFYSQKRVGLKGRVFNFYKFRSMCVDADKQKERLFKKNESKDNVMFKIKKDPRVTKLGKILRKYSLDELPQLFNVLKGDMSMVGPRPPLPDEVAKYDREHMERLSIKPGLTGLSQVKGRSDLSFSRWVRWDLWYINNWSLTLDLRILLWTVPAVLKGKGAY
jgi:exopolysaccharide biosynthesis polyprenyl glycosylphosphotransferase